MQNNDYFTARPPPTGEYLLDVVERYHLSDKFWKKFQDGNYKSNFGDLKYVLRYFPNHPKALYLLGRIAILTQNSQLPISYFQKALRLYPQHAYTHAQYGNYLAENSDDDILIKEGIAELKKAIEMYPKLTKAYAWLANAYNKIGNSELALQADKKAEELGYQSENEGQSVKNAKERVQQDKTQVPPVKVEKVNNDYFTTPQDDKLLSIVEKYNLDTEIFWKVIMEGDSQFAISNLKDVLRYFPNHPKALYLLGRMAQYTKNESLPISYYHKAMRLYPQHAYTHAQYGHYLSEIGDDDILIKEGIAELKKAIEMYPKLTKAYAWLANAYNKIGNSELALQADKKAEERVQQDKTQVPPVKVEKVNNDYFTTPQDDKLLSIVEKYNLDTEIFWKVIMEEDSQFAISKLKEVLRYFPNHPEALYLLGRMTQYTKNESLPISYYHKALKLFPQHAYTHAQYGHYLSENSDDDILIKEGIAELNNSIEMNPKLAVAYTWLANAYNKIGNSELALQADKKAEELGYQSENEGQSVKNAKERVQQDKTQVPPVKVEKLNKDYFTIPQDDKLLSIVEKYNLETESFWKVIMEEDSQFAISNLKDVLRYFPNHPKALYLLGRMAQYTKNESLPLSYYRKALELFPQHAYTHAQYGHYLSEIGEDDILIEEGIAELNNSIEMDPKLAEAYAWLANAYNKIGNSELAIQADKKAKELDHQDEMPDRILKND